ncbi:general odorant-binding protein 72-like isoform X2 [Chrysoperla carnea]|uniref:general odorant-binding protein 72-like isoform X2 n=1 Tax=Chrysoperla carnea TaxID=189513 RepID=UPI001D09493F|nr:general odorant-binding protein 72-like isoform X2 [Chrysoperla carnea]
MTDRPKAMFLICLIIVNNLYYTFALTEAQMASTAKLMRKMCQPKTKVTDEQIDNFHKGVFDDDKKMMCYMNCILETMKIIPTLPKKYQESTRKSMDECINKVTGEKCEPAYNFAKCIYLSNPEMYFLP